MMYNNAVLVGRVGKKEIKQLKNGSGDVTILSIATTKKYKDPQGAKQEYTTWHNVNCFSKLSEVASSYIHVGDLVLIQGEIQNRKIETGEKAGQYIYSITAADIKFLPKGAPKDATSPSPKQQDKPQLDMFEDQGIPF